MAGDDPSPTDPVATGFARLAAATRLPLEAQYQPAETPVTQSLRAICNGLLVLGILLAISASTYASLSL